MTSYTKYWKNLATIIIVAGSMFFSIIAVAAQDLAYQQTPGHFGGFGSDGQTITVADDFQLDQPALLQNITWWGGYGSTNPHPLPADHFIIRLFADDGGKPGALLQTLKVNNNTKRVATGAFVNPPVPDYFEGRAEFKYSFNLPKPFQAAANTRYWLSIVNVPNQDIWLWEVSDSLINLGVQRSFTDPVVGPWEPYFDNTAFQLNTARG